MNSRCSLVCAMALVAIACRSDAPDADERARGGKPSAERGADESAIAAGVVLEAAAQERIGVRLQTLTASAVAERIVGLGVVESIAPLAQLDAESSQSRAVTAAARAALARAEALYADHEGTSLAVVEAARRDAAAAGSTAELAERRLAIDWGGGGPLADGTSRTAWLTRLIAGRAALVRAQFPVGASVPPATTELAIEPLARDGATLVARHAWSAPGDPAVPGVALFLLVEAPQAPRSGDRVRVVARGALHAGVVVPATALVLADGATWCYVSASPTNSGSERFVRRPLAIDRPEGAGYFVSAGLAPGDRVVVTGGGSLLAEEVGAAGAAAAGDDED